MPPYNWGDMERNEDPPQVSQGLQGLVVGSIGGFVIGYLAHMLLTAIRG